MKAEKSSGFVGEMMKDSQALKPLSCTIEGTEARVAFDAEELRRYLTRSTDTVLWVEDSQGNRAPIRVEFVREILARP